MSHLLLHNFVTEFLLYYKSHHDKIEKNYENEILSVLGAYRLFYRSNRESIQNNQDCQTLQFLRQQILHALAFKKISLLRKIEFQKSEIKHNIGPRFQKPTRWCFFVGFRSVLI
jgi:hypothetical protein